MRQAESSGQDLAQFALLVVGVWEGVVPLICALVRADKEPWLALPLQLDRPGAIVVSILMILLTGGLIVWLDGVKRRGKSAP